MAESFVLRQSYISNNNLDILKIITCYLSVTNTLFKCFYIKKIGQVAAVIITKRRPN